MAAHDSLDVLVDAEREERRTAAVEVWGSPEWVPSWIDLGYEAAADREEEAT